MAIAVSRLADGVFVEANEAFLAMHGYLRDEVLGSVHNQPNPEMPYASATK